MKHMTFPLCVLMALPVLLLGTRASAKPTAPRADIVATAVGDGRFEVLAAALNQADLISTLRSKGPFTVFAPTDEAFAALPAAVVSDLLRPENKSALQRILMAHVVEGHVTSADLLPTQSVKTLASASFALGLRVGNATVVQADVACSNGVIHVIDTVLLPPAEEKKVKPLDARVLIHAAISKGVLMFNAGDAQGCAEVYHDAAERLVKGGRDVLSDKALHDLRRTIAAAPEDASKYAWALRRAFDRVLEDMAFEPKAEAALPDGFPKPGPVGRVVRKQYPKYRAARAEGAGQGGAFWTLFRHIKTNNVAMTAPVEMSMDENMRMMDMAFLYESQTQGRAGSQGSVQVLDLDPVDVLSIGMRGRRSDEGIQSAKHLVEARMKALGVAANGSWRVLGYNSPMVPASKQYWELQIPVVGQ